MKERKREGEREREETRQSTTTDHKNASGENALSTKTPPGEKRANGPNAGRTLTHSPPPTLQSRFVYL